MADTIIDTEDGFEVVIPAADWRVLKDWPGLDMSKLITKDGEVYPRRKDGSVNTMSLSDLLVLARPTQTPEPEAPKAAETLDEIGCDIFASAAPRTGTPRGTLAKFIAAGSARPGGSAPPPYWHNGRKFRAIRPDTAGAVVAVNLTDDQSNLVGRCHIARDLYLALITNPRTRVDAMLWRLSPEGYVLTRNRANPDAPVVIDLKALLKSLRLPPEFTIERFV